MKFLRCKVDVCWYKLTVLMLFWILYLVVWYESNWRLLLKCFFQSFILLHNQNWTRLISACGHSKISFVTFQEVISFWKFLSVRVILLTVIINYELIKFDSVACLIFRCFKEFLFQNTFTLTWQSILRKFTVLYPFLDSYLLILNSSYFLVKTWNAMDFLIRYARYDILRKLKITLSSS